MEWYCGFLLDSWFGMMRAWLRLEVRASAPAHIADFCLTRDLDDTRLTMMGWWGLLKLIFLLFFLPDLLIFENLFVWAVWYPTVSINPQLFLKIDIQVSCKSTDGKGWAHQPLVTCTSVNYSFLVVVYMCRHDSCHVMENTFFSLLTILTDFM